MDCDEEDSNPSLDQWCVYQLVFELTAGDPRKANVFMVAEMGPLP